jgi:hypothetical protein
VEIFKIDSIPLGGTNKNDLAWKREALEEWRRFALVLG